MTGQKRHAPIGIVVGAFLLIIAAPVPTLLAADSRAPETRLMVETDPLPIAFGGFSAHLGVVPARTDRLALGISVIAGPELPRFFVERRSENADKSFTLRINQGAGVWLHVSEHASGTGWFTGLQLFTQEVELTRKTVPNERNRTNLAMGAIQVGYRWFPFREEHGFYVRPWAGGGLQWVVRATFEPDEVTTDTTVGGEEYILDRWIPFAAVHVGWQF